VLSPLVAHCQSFMPEGLQLFGGPILSATLPLPAYAERFARVRRNEYYSGRHYGRLGLTNIGAYAYDIPNSGNGAPIWPKGIVGSITHTRKNCIVGLATMQSFSAVGIDLEVAGAVLREVYADIMSVTEIEFVGNDRLLPTVVFSAKESFFKFCQSEHYIDFLAVEVSINGSSLAVTPRSYGEANGFGPACGVWCEHHGEVFTALYSTN
jgi:enterobactin synthetase component D / holo-[acyl-carrier protein] synthase